MDERRLADLIGGALIGAGILLALVAIAPLVTGVTR